VLMALLMGLRAHEVVQRTVRDLDDNGRLLVIGSSKTRAGVRTVAVPPLLRPRLLALTANRAADAMIFTEPSSPRRASGCSRH
jgi:integrase